MQAGLCAPPACMQPFTNQKMKKNTTILLVISSYLLSAGIAFGCECAKGTYDCMHGIKKYPFVAMVEVMKKDTISGIQSGTSKDFAKSTGYSFTTVKILKLYSGRYSGQEIKIIDSKGYECFIRLFYKNIGDTLIVKGEIADVNKYVFSDWDKQLPNESILVLGLCSMNQLLLEKNNVIGWISKDKSHRWSRRNQFLKNITFGLVDRRKKGWKKFEHQQMKIEKFERKLRKRIKNRR